MEEEKYMRRCIELAKNGLCNVSPNPMVGAVIVSSRIKGWLVIILASNFLPFLTKRNMTSGEVNCPTTPSPLSLILIIEEAKSISFSNNLTGNSTRTLSLVRCMIGATDWEKGYQNLRNVNYFFYHYEVPENLETDEVLSLRGEAYFLRAYWHFYLLTRFGDIPIMDDFWDGNATLEGLQIPASKRSDVARFILSDLKAAIGEIPEAKASLFPRSKYSQRGGCYFGYESGAL